MASKYFFIDLGMPPWVSNGCIPTTMKIYKKCNISRTAGPILSKFCRFVEMTKGYILA
jgi:hypothetical protein